MREKITNRISEELKVILVKFFDEDKVDSFIQNIMDDLLILTSINMLDRGDRTSTFAPGSYFTSRIRSVADRIITFAKNNLDNTGYFNFLSEFGDMMLIEGELFLASEIFQNILRYSTNNDIPTAKASANLNLARISIRQANWQDAHTYLNTAKDLFSKHDDKNGLSKCYHLLGNIAIEKGDLNSARSLLNEGLSFLNKKKDKLLVGNIELNLGIVAHMEEKYDEALELYESSLNKFEECDDNRKFAETKNNIGLLYIHKKQYEYALFEYDECIELSLEGRYQPTLGIAYLNKAFIYSEISELKLASYYAGKAMDICYKINDQLSIADVYKIQGIISKKQFEFQLAEDYFKASLRLNEELQNEPNYAETAFEIGLFYRELNGSERAVYYLKEAFTYYKKINAEGKLKQINEYLNQP